MAIARIKLKPDDDGLRRVLLGSYYKPPIPYGLQLQLQTGVDWKFLGCFMDSCCWATGAEIDYVTIDFGKNGTPVLDCEILG